MLIINYQMDQVNEYTVLFTEIIYQIFIRY